MTPKFQPEIEQNPHVNQPEGFTCIQCPHKLWAECEACGEIALRDAATRACRACWRSTRGAYLAGLGALVASELGGEWRHRGGGWAGVIFSFSATLLAEAGGVARLLSEWERVKP